MVFISLCRMKTCSGNLGKLVSHECTPEFLQNINKTFVLPEEPMILTHEDLLRQHRETNECKPEFLEKIYKKPTREDVEIKPGDASAALDLNAFPRETWW